MHALDFRHVLLDDVPIFATATKQAMRKEARHRGYSADAITLAVNRFNRFWILAQWVEYPRVLRCATHGGDTVLITLPTPPYRSV